MRHSTIALVTPATMQPVSIGEARKQCEVYDTEDDTFIKRLIRAATRYGQTVTRRTFMATTYDVYFDAFPSGDDPLRLPRNPVLSITSVKYVDEDGVEQTEASTVYDYTLGVDVPRAIIYLKPNQSWSSPRQQRKAVIVRSVHGYSSSADEETAQLAVPEETRHALLMLVGHWFKHREPTIEGTISVPVPMSVKSLFLATKVMEAA